MADHPDAAWPFDTIATLNRPAVFLIGDDPVDRRALGPHGWPIGAKLRTWARAVIVHGAAGEAKHYREAVRAADLVQRCVMVETDSAHAVAWGRFFNCPATLLILPCGGVHPVAETRGSVH